MVAFGKEYLKRALSEFMGLEIVHIPHKERVNNSRGEKDVGVHFIKQGKRQHGGGAQLCVRCDCACELAIKQCIRMVTGATLGTWMYAKW
jgi:hypothetical protein